MNNLSRTFENTSFYFEYKISRIYPCKNLILDTLQDRKRFGKIVYGELNEKVSRRRLIILLDWLRNDGFTSETLNVVKIKFY